MTEQTDDGPTRKLAPADRAARLDEQQKRLVGISIRGPYEPGDTLVDRFVSQYESDRLQYVEWQHCVSREHEILTSTKKDQKLTVLTSGEFKLSQSNKIEPCDTSSEIHLRYALMRRGLAMEQANLLKYSKHEAWLEKLLTTRLEAPPPGFARVSFQQLEAADKKLFVLLAEKTRSGVKAQPAGRPCDDHFEACMNSTEVLTLMQPKPVAAKTRDEVESPPKRQRTDSGPTKGKGKSKNKAGSNSFQRIPTDLLQLGCVANTSQGNRLCFSYNVKKCSNMVNNQRCDKGLHACAVRGCGKPHAALDCPNKKTE